MEQHRRIPQQERSERTRERIIAAGEKLFAEVGYAQTTSKQIAKAAKVAIGSFYNYFPDKKALMLEVFRRHLSEVHQLAGVLESYDATKVDPAVFLRTAVMQAFESHRGGPAFHIELDTLKNADEDFARIHYQEQTRIQGALANMLRNNRQHFAVVDFDATAYVIVVTLEAIVHELLMNEPTMGKERILDTITEVLLTYLLPKSSAPGKS